MLPPSPPTDPDVQNYRIRFFAGELRGQTEDERAPNYRAPRHHAWPSLAESPVRLSIVVTWTRLWAQSPLACFPAMGLSHGASLPSFGSRRARFPALSGTMKALRLPIRVPAVTYLFRSRRPRNPSFVRVPPQRSWKIGGLFQAGASRLPCSGSLAWTRVGSLRSSGDPSRAFAAFQDPGRVKVSSPVAATSMLPPLPIRRRPQRYPDFGANPQLQHSLPYASRVALPHTCKARFRLAGCAFAGRDSNPLDRYERFQLVGLTIVLLSCSPDANGFRAPLPTVAAPE